MHSRHTSSQLREFSDNGRHLVVRAHLNNNSNTQNMPTNNSSKLKLVCTFCRGCGTPMPQKGMCWWCRQEPPSFWRTNGGGANWQWPLWGA